MDRRSFLALIASAPIAALTPLPKILESRAYDASDKHLGIAIRFVKQWDIWPPRYAIVRHEFAVRVISPDNPYVSQPKTDAERLALKMVTEARARFRAT